MSRGKNQPSVWRENGTTWFEHVCRDRILKYSLPEVIWSVLCELPLTIRANISCNLCGLQGRMVEGEWVPIERLPHARP